MWKDPVVEEIRIIRDSYARRFDYDLSAIGRDLSDKEKRAGRKLLDPAPRKLEAVRPERSA